MKTIYVAGPYRAHTPSGVLANRHIAEICGMRLCANGWAPYIPHCNLGGFEIYDGIEGLCDKVWLAIGLEWVHRCDAVFVLHGWEHSEGTKAEITEAKLIDLPIYYQKDGFPDATD